MGLNNDFPLSNGVWTVSPSSMFLSLHPDSDIIFSMWAMKEAKLGSTGLTTIGVFLRHSCDLSFALAYHII